MIPAAETRMIGVRDLSIPELEVTTIEVGLTTEIQVDTTMVGEENMIIMDLVRKVAGEMKANMVEHPRGLLVVTIPRVVEATEALTRDELNHPNTGQAIEAIAGTTMVIGVRTGNQLRTYRETMETEHLPEATEATAVTVKVAEERTVVTADQEAAAEVGEEGAPTYRDFPLASRILSSLKSRRGFSSFCILLTAKRPMGTRWKVDTDVGFSSILDSGIIF